ncbi:hypothetical protein I79_021324 [Cricetulus griseus]|uniref:Uncharacterized protein n=1 Tax=Cricetulus griseus TaxID=10029 RepID=G3ICD1_CRIGR|nr:hypothetical protein I79_021324 [Cricetulus griseus]
MGTIPVSTTMLVNMRYLLSAKHPEDTSQVFTCEGKLKNVICMEKSLPASQV